MCQTGLHFLSIYILDNLCSPTHRLLYDLALLPLKQQPRVPVSPQIRHDDRARRVGVRARQRHAEVEVEDAVGAARRPDGLAGGDLVDARKRPQVCVLAAARRRGLDGRRGGGVLAEVVRLEPGGGHGRVELRVARDQGRLRGELDAAAVVQAEVYLAVLGVVVHGAVGANAGVELAAEVEEEPLPDILLATVPRQGERLPFLAWN